MGLFNDETPRLLCVSSPTLLVWGGRLDNRQLTCCWRQARQQYDRAGVSLFQDSLRELADSENGMKISTLQ